MNLEMQNPTDPIAAAHSQKFLEFLIERIRSQGPIAFVDFMNLALYAPGQGYYVAGATKLGRGGDFITAPELSPLYAHCLARQVAEVLETLGGETEVLELGAGSGLMALELLRELERLDRLPTTYIILELSPELRERQEILFDQEAPELKNRVRWVDTLPKIRGVILANEVMDAMPVHRFKMEDSLKEFYVTEENGELAWALKPASSELIKALEDAELKLTPPYESEINLCLPAWIKSLGEALSEGLILLIDYGFPRHEYYHPERSMGTLMCYYQHQAHGNPLILPGIQDITAHVDFTRVAEAAVEAGLTVAGFTNQASFLLNCGLVDSLGELSLEQRLAIQQLTLPTEMGELFKAIALTKEWDSSLRGFAYFDQRHRLS